MREFGFELRLCARLESRGELVARQLGAGVRRPGNRIVDVLRVDPGPAFEERVAITPRTIPDAAIEADVGAGRARPVGEAFPDLPPERARAVADRAVAAGFFERERRGGRDLVRRATRYPEDWFAGLRAVENKPDLAAPGDLETQLRTDVRLGLVDEVVLATASHVTGAHRNRIPDEVGIWRVRDGVIDVLREPTPLAVDGPGVEITAEEPARTDVRFVTPAEKRRARRRLAERAYGKGFRNYELPGCGNVEPAAVDGVGGLPHCVHHGRLVDPATDCGPSCPGYDPDDPPGIDLDAERDRASPWVADPDGRASRQVGLDRFP